MRVPQAASSTTASQKPGKQTFPRKEQELSEIDNTIKRLVDEAEIRGVVDGIDLATDAKDWELCRSYFTVEIFANFTSLAGGEPARMPANDLVNAWRTNLYADKLSHHMRTNRRISLREDNAEVFSKGYALNILERDTGSDLWEVWGEYTHTLERTPEGWRCSGMTFTVTHARGNEMAREFIPDE